MALPFARYVALGDSMSMDLFPALDAGEIDVAVALERDPAAGRVAPLGAASLLYRNDDARFPEETADDLVSRYPGIELLNLASDRATIGEVFGEQLMQVEESGIPTLVTLTVGANDLLSAFSTKPRASLLEAIARDVAEAYDFLVDAIRRSFPVSVLVLTTINDPSDDTGHIPKVLEDVGKLPLDVIKALNDQIRTIASGTPKVLLADAHAHFMGHGASVPEEERWYWRRSQVELNVAGAHELRTLWRAALDDAGA